MSQVTLLINWKFKTVYNLHAFCLTKQSLYLRIIIDFIFLFSTCIELLVERISRINCELILQL